MRMPATNRDIPVVHIPHSVGDLEHDVGGILLALEMVRCQQVAALAQVLQWTPPSIAHQALHLATKRKAQAPRHTKYITPEHQAQPTATE